ncbi:MAG TPA: alanine--tRNA ligase [Cytophagales bacterium]|nr:alanine--tRNA ligase [Cytophagales bacterium]
MTSKEIRARFLEFFKEKQHQIVASAPMVIKNDPTLMFTNAGMNQFKDYFLGNQTAEVPRVADTQKCLRVSGKHNDLEEVGIDTYHHTMFEMLGNWSFGDYFKKDAITWAWELLTEVYQLPVDRLYVTVFQGDEADGLPADEEAADYWKQHIDAERILYCDKKDNFWEMGDTGPCGPCSEIHIDLRTDDEISQQPGIQLVNADHPQVIEIWNLVFMQFNRLLSGKLESLPAQHVDTGMGFERLVRAIQGKSSNYDTDVFTPMLDRISMLSGKKYGSTEEIDIAMRVVVDHVHAVAFAIADGQLPSNNGAGYVIRRILRRAVRYGYTFLGLYAPFIFHLIEELSEQFGETFPEIPQQKDFIAKVIREEEAGFLRTLETGLKRLEQIAEKSGKGGEVAGATAFELYDTYGFPFDLTALIAREKGLTVDEAGFEKEMEQQKQRSKAAAKTETGDWTILREEDGVDFLGYEHTQSDALLVKYREVKGKKKSTYQLVLNQTPFYAESGGPVGDTGVLEGDGETIRVVDTVKENDLIVHITDKIPNKPEATFQAKVNTERRRKITNNHSATHLLHAALRQVLGDHVQQKGSLVNDSVLRFDFSHFAKMTEEELAEVEAIVNRKVRENITKGEARNVPIEEAKEMGAMALFGEKYGDFVRVITFDPSYSVELCGGVHVPATGQIGYFKITSESSVAAGVRRIEAVTSEGAERFLNGELDIVEQVKALLKNPKDLTKSVQSLLDERNALAKEIETLHAAQAGQIKEGLLKKVEPHGDAMVLIDQVALPSADALKKLSFELKQQVGNLFMVLAADIKGKPQIAVMIDEALVEAKSLNAGKIVKDLAKNIQGGGGGQPFFATAGGKKLEGLPDAVAAAQELAAATF